MPMTRLVNALLAYGIERVEQGVENVREPPPSGSPRTQRKKEKPSMANPTAREQLLERLLRDCVLAL